MVDCIEDVGDESGMRRAPQVFEQYPRTGHRERQDQPLRLGEIQCLLDGCARGGLLAQVAAGERVQEVVGLDPGEDGGRAVEDVL